MRNLEVDILDDKNHYALIKCLDGVASTGLLLDKYQYEQLRLHFVSHCDSSEETVEAEKCKECDGKGEYYHETVQSYMTCPYCHGTKTEK